jgi:hypothetical protein
MAPTHGATLGRLADAGDEGVIKGLRAIRRLKLAGRDASQSGQDAGAPPERVLAILRVSPERGRVIDI